MSEPTYEELMEELRLAWGKLMIELLREWVVKPTILFLRFMLWLNG